MKKQNRLINSFQRRNQTSLKHEIINTRDSTRSIKGTFIAGFLLMSLFIGICPGIFAETLSLSNQDLFSDSATLNLSLFPEEKNIIIPDSVDYDPPSGQAGVSQPGNSNPLPTFFPQYNPDAVPFNSSGITVPSGPKIDPGFIGNTKKTIPTAQFSATPIRGQAPLTVRFSDLSTGMPDTWYWEFGDGNSSSSKNPVYTYRTEGDYTVTLTASNDLGYDLENSRIQVIHEKTVVIAEFFYALKGKGLPQKVEFFDMSEGYAEKWLWDFGDGTTSTDEDPVHEYKDPGNYDVTLKASNKLMSSSATHQVIIDEEIKPVAAFSLDVWNGTSPLMVHFTDTSSGDPTKWKWDFDDGTTSTERNPVHTYKKEGDYWATLTASNTKGASDYSIMISVAKGMALAKPKAEFRYSILSSCKPVAVATDNRSTSAQIKSQPDFSSGMGSIESDNPINVAFTDISTGEPEEWMWDFGDEWFSTNQNPTHTYNRPGKYLVYLKVVNLKGESSSSIMLDIPECDYSS